jgi:Protein of unknown function (DUF3592)
MRFLRLFPYIFLASGIALLAVGVFAFQHTLRFVRSAVTAPGVVTELVWQEQTTSNGYSGAYHPRVRFRASTGQDVTFISNIGSNLPAYHENQTVNVLYDPQNPYHAELGGFSSLWLVTIIFTALGVVFSAIGVVPLVLGTRKKELAAWLRTNGQRIQTDFERVEVNTGLQVNGASPYRIVSQWQNPATKDVYVFRSDNIWYDPTKYITRKTIDVIIDPHDPGRYVVETGFLPRAR